MENNKEQKQRPTSPHLGIYSPQISSVLSIFHRMTGVVLFCSMSLLVWGSIFFALSDFDTSFTKTFAFSFVIKFIAYSLSFVFFYHLSTGIRHLIWDMGYLLSKRALHITGWLAIFSSIIFTFLFWVFI
ncbi:MAG: succinate dehydrogenase, cytochrome b556 subunit [Rickettsiaceae bacterium]|nr:succinate dehydrogenase, cytochrome b556 subunit [Rickettsiaceae bacterium]